MEQSLIKRSRLQELEEIIEEGMAAFLRVGNALLEIRENNLYEQDGFNTFTEYLEERWPQYQRRHLYRQMDATYIYGYIESKNVSNWTQIQTTEGVIRPLSKLGTPIQVEKGEANPDLWVDAWVTACELASPNYPTESHIIHAVNRILKNSIGKEIPDSEIWNGQWELNKIYQADVTSKAWLDTIPRDSVDFIVTDPPWRPDPDKAEDEENNKYILYEVLGRLAEKTLKPGGACAIYFGKLDLPILFHIMDQWLDYEWCFASYQPHSTWNFRKTQFKECWRPIAIFRKPGNKFHTVYFPDAIESKREKGYHEWQQGVEPVKLLIEKYTVPGQLVLEPFLGGGTGIIASEQAEGGRRNWLAFDIDQNAIKATMERLIDGKILEV